MLTSAVTDGVMLLSVGEREELAIFLLESLRDDDETVEEQIDLEATPCVDGVDHATGVSPLPE